MKTLVTVSLSVLALAAGSGAAVLAAPLFHTHADPTARIVPMWAHDYRTLGAMTADADAVVLARVERTLLGRTVPTTGTAVLPFTYVDLAVEQVLAGSAEADITLEQTGGQLDDASIFASGDGGPYRAGERVVLFLKRQTDTGLFYLAHPKGRFQVENGRLEALELDDPVARELDGKLVADVRLLLKR